MPRRFRARPSWCFRTADTSRRLSRPNGSTPCSRSSSPARRSRQSRGEGRVEFYHFSETAYPFIPDLDKLAGVRVDLPNQVYDPVKGADLYHARLDEWGLC